MSALTAPEVFDEPFVSLPQLALVLLGTDRQCDASELPAGDDDRRGWWGAPSMGSRLWLLYRQPLTAESVARAEAYAREALLPLQAAGIVSGVSVTARVSAGRLDLDITLDRPDDSPVTVEWSTLWGA